MSSTSITPESAIHLSQLIHFQAQKRPEKIAFSYQGQPITFGDFYANTIHVAHILKQLGIQPQQRIVSVSQDSIDQYVLLFACSMINAVHVPINWRFAPDELSFIIKDSDAALVIGQQSLIQASEDTRHFDADITYENGHLLSQMQAYAEATCTHFIPSTDDALIDTSTEFDTEQTVLQLYTSGTTGKPKGVLIPQRSFFALPQFMASQGDQWMNITAEDTLLLSLPIFHIGGVWWAIQGFRAGACGIVEPMFVPWRALELIEAHEITLCALVPAMLHACLSEADIDDTDLDSVRGVLYGGSPIAPSLLSDAMARFDADFFQIYGMTETGNMAVCLRPEDHQAINDTQDIPALTRLGIVGKPLPGVTIQIRLPEGSEHAGELCANNELGEIYIHSPSVMRGYWRNHHATQGTLENGWIKTGDIGYFDTDGYLMVCDRVKDMIIRAGENIYPAEIEAALCAHADIKEAAIIGIPHHAWGESIHAVLVSDLPLTLADIQDWLTQRIASHKRPSSIEIVDALPRNASGKVLKHILRKPHWVNQNRLIN